MENLPIYISIIMMLTTFLTLFIFYRATCYSNLPIIILLVWLTLQTVISLNGFYTKTHQTPPPFLLAIVPPFLFIIILFITPWGKRYLDNLNLKQLTLLHIIRVPVEIVLFFLSVHKVVPELMTFEGRNLDILSGLSAPLIYYLGFVKNKLSTKAILLWNVICLGLLFNIVIHAILSAPFPFQQLAFSQPNIAVLYFPFIWLPCCIVPLVFLSHLTAIRQLIVLNKKTAANSMASLVKPV